MIPPSPRQYLPISSPIPSIIRPQPGERGGQLEPSVARTSLAHVIRPLSTSQASVSSSTMDAVNIPTDSLPEGLKQCEQILKRASELKKVEPVVAYWCCFSAAQKALKVPIRTREDTMFLMSLLDALEEMKAILSTNEAVTNEAAGSAYIENFALKVFMSADNDDRAGNCGKATIRKFVVAGQFIEVLTCFESGITEEMEQKLQYARWKATDLAKALREGRTPVPGPPVPEVSEESVSPFPSLGAVSSDLPLTGYPSPPRGSFSSTQRPTIITGSPSTSAGVVSPRPSPPHRGRAELPSPPSRDNLHTPIRPESQGSGSWSTLATPGLPDSEDGEPQQAFPPVSTIPPGARLSPPRVRSPSTGDSKTVRFMGPDGAPLSPAQTMASVDAFDEIPAPPPTAFSASPTSPVGQSQSLPLARTGGDSAVSTTPITRPTGGTTVPRPAPVTGFIPQSSAPAPPPPSLASPPRPPVQAQPHGLGLTSSPPAPVRPPVAPVPVAAVSASALPPVRSLTRREVEQVQKHAKWAISALEFDDPETARTELLKALAMLG